MVVRRTHKATPPPDGIMSESTRETRPRQSPIEAALGPIAIAAVNLFAYADFDRIKECCGHACGWRFYAASNNNRRRWREMAVCGDRAKQRRLAAGRRGV
jgi:predicted RNA-binding Zn ribbon-like protein